MSSGGNRKGHFLSLKSPDAARSNQREKSRLPGSPSTSLNQQLDTEIRIMRSWFRAQGLQPHPWDIQADQWDMDEVIHTRNTFLARLHELAGLKHLPESWEIVVYYTGHGEEGSGDWVLANDEVLSLEDVVNQFRSLCSNSVQRANILVISDCCYSGQWLQRAEQLQQDGEFNTSSGDEISLAIQASAGPTDAAYAEFFTTAWHAQLAPTEGSSQKLSYFATARYKDRSVLVPYLQST